MENRLPSPGSASWGTARNADAQRVLRNTYWLLALSMIPTVLGAYLAMEFGFGAAIMSAGGMGLIVFLVVAFAFIFAIQKFRNSGVGVALLLLFTGFMGAMLSPMLSIILGKSNGASLVMTAFAGTAVIMAGMATLASVIKRDLSFMGKFLFVGLLMLIVAGIANIFLQSSTLMITLSVISIGLFSAYLLYDLKQILDGGETSYVSATLSIYLDLFNIFQNLLSLLGIFGGSDD